jgi:hypothetical protein
MTPSCISCGFIAMKETNQLIRKSSMDEETCVWANYELKNQLKEV